MKNTKVSVITMDQKEISFQLKHLKMMDANFITVEMSSKDWLETGRLKPVEYEITPESLKELIEIIETLKFKNKLLSLGSSKAFLKCYPTKEILVKKLEENKKLPIDYEWFIFHVDIKDYVYRFHSINLYFLCLILCFLVLNVCGLWWGI